jgi:hypothetical protein
MYTEKEMMVDGEMSGVMQAPAKRILPGSSFLN